MPFSFLCALLVIALFKVAPAGTGKPQGDASLWDNSILCLCPWV